MQAIEIKQPGGPEVLVPTQRVDPVPKAGELLIAVTASGINRPDVLQRKGLYPTPSCGVIRKHAITSVGLGS